MDLLTTIEKEKYYKAETSEYYLLYLITNKINGKQYIGITQKSIQFRFKQHCYNKNKPLNNDIQKFGKYNFEIEELLRFKTSSIYLAHRLESFMIKTFETQSPSGYNNQVVPCNLDGLECAYDDLEITTSNKEYINKMFNSIGGKYARYI